ncbi:MAG TPA: ABC transporter ATP-binding protein, partial [Tissierellaceae bacterium]
TENNKGKKQTGISAGRHGKLGQVADKPKDFKGTLKRLLKYLKPYSLMLTIVLIMAVLATVFSVISPRVIGLVTDSLVDSLTAGKGVNFDYIIKILKILVAIYLSSALFQYIQHFIMAGISQKMVYDLRREVNEKISRLPLKYFDSNTTGDILSRVINDVDTISRTLEQNITQFITAIITLVGIFIMMLAISPVITLVTLITIPLSVLLTKNIAKTSQGHFMKQAKSLGDLNGHVEEMYSGHIVIKAYGYEDRSIEKFEKINEDLYESSWKAQFISGIIMPMMHLINNLGYIFVSVVGGVYVIQGKIRIGEMQAFLNYAKRFTQPIIQTAEIINEIQSTVASAERVFELLDEEEEVEYDGIKVEIDNPQGDVVFENVNFGYDKDEMIIENMNIHVKPGETVAIVGPTGAGKTTLVNLLMRFYEIDSGKITVDNVDIKNMNRKDLRSMFGMVLQDTWLFNGTIKENIAYSKDNATDIEVVNAAKSAQLDYYIRTLPDGYDTLINEEASNISQGQKQLLTIARVILKDPSILILDEATSSVDTRTEILIQKAMDELMKDRTSFVIAHRLSTIRNADMILVMKEGKIIEQGTHDELLDKKGFYYELYNSQFAA